MTAARCAQGGAGMTADSGGATVKVSVRYDYGFQLLHTGLDNDHDSRSDLGIVFELLSARRHARV